MSGNSAKRQESWRELAKRQLEEFTLTTQRYRYALQRIAQLRQGDDPAGSLLREADRIARDALGGDDG